MELCELLGLHTVPVLWRGVYDREVIQNIWSGEGTYPTRTTTVEYPQTLDDFMPTTAEGYVVRVADSFHYDDFQLRVAKYVRKNHVQTTGNWMTKPVFPNKLLGDNT